MEVEIKDLQAGDIVFFINHYYMDGADIHTPVNKRYDKNWVYPDHVALYAGIDERTKLHSLAHSIPSDANSMTKPLPGFNLTSLRPLIGQTDVVEGKTIKYDVEFRVFRVEDTSKRERAIALFRQWINTRIPYSDKRLQSKLDLEQQGMSAEGFVELAKDNYDKSGKYRQLKFAVRAGENITRPKVNAPGTGVTCSHAVVMAYQTAGCEDNVRKRTTEDKWVSDKYGTPSPAALADQGYTAYLKEIGNGAVINPPTAPSGASASDDVLGLPPSTPTNKRVRSGDSECSKKSPKESQIASPSGANSSALTPFLNECGLDESSVCSYEFLNPDFKHADFVDKIFPIDAKTIGAEGLLKYIDQEIQGGSSLFKDLGTLIVPDIPFSDETKKAYQEARKNAIVYVLRSRQILVREGVSSPEKHKVAATTTDAPSFS